MTRHIPLNEQKKKLKDFIKQSIRSWCCRYLALSIERVLALLCERARATIQDDWGRGERA